MSHNCLNYYEIEDSHTSDLICSNCGLILDKIYTNYDFVFEKKFPLQEEISEILERLNLPNSLAYDIAFECEKDEKLSKEEYLMFKVYEILNKKKIPISLKEVANVSNFSSKEISRKQENQTISISIFDYLEKFGNILKINYSDIKKIQEYSKKISISGHSPLTITATLIYKYSKENKIDLSIDRIANVLNVSKISIQRYYKKIKKII